MADHDRRSAIRLATFQRGKSISMSLATHQRVGAERIDIHQPGSQPLREALMKPQPDRIRQALAGVMVFSDIDGKALASLAASAQEQQRAKGEVIFQCGDQPTGLHIIVSGLVKETCLSPDGREKVIEVFDALSSIGEAWLFQNRPYPCSAIALRESCLLHINKADLLEISTRYPEILDRFLAKVSRRILMLVSDIESISLKSNAQKVAAYLLDKHDCRPSGRDSLCLTIPKCVVASRLGMTPETLSRICGDLIRAGVIEVCGQRISIVDQDRLTAWANASQEAETSVTGVLCPLRRPVERHLPALPS